MEIAQTEGALHLAEVQAERDWSTVVLLLAEDGETDAHFISVHAGNRTAALRSFQSYKWLNCTNN